MNKSFAFELIESVPPKKVTERIVSCDGGGGALGHPKVYINLVCVDFLSLFLNRINLALIHVDIVAYGTRKSPPIRLIKYLALL